MRLSIVLSFVLVLFATQLASAERRARHRRMPAPALVQVTAGAIAYSPSTGQIGLAHGYGDQESARFAAEQSCGYDDCRWQVSEQGAVAVFVLGNGGANYHAWDRDFATAQQRALELCSANATGCYVARWVAN